ncbi:MAG: hypothetical protein M3250_04350 [Thermoproteota archaeon]|nr:hypothetical protein [Thermoproteota archaeon]
MNKALIITAVAVVLASSIVMIDSVALQRAEANGPGCSHKSGAADTTTITPNTPNAVSTQTPSLAYQTV